MELLPCAVLGEIYCALSRQDEARRVVQAALLRLRERVAQIASPTWRASYLALPEQRRLRRLANVLCPQELLDVDP